MKKGFTLIELLAVIVILAIIAVIATPIVLNIIENTKMSAFKSTINGINRAIQIYASNQINFAGENFDFFSVNIYYDNTADYDVKLLTLM